MTDPNYLPYASAVPTYSRDADHLRILSILHYVWGGLILVLSCFAIIYIVLGAMILSGTMKFPPPGPPGAPAAQQPSPDVFGYMFIGFGSCGFCLGATIGICSIISGRHMMQRRSRVFSIVIASISCLSVPLGTTLGVFTIVVLMRESVKALYAGTAQSPATMAKSWPPEPS